MTKQEKYAERIRYFIKKRNTTSDIAERDRCSIVISVYEHLLNCPLKHHGLMSDPNFCTKIF